MNKEKLITSCIDLICYVEGIEDRDYLFNILKNKSFIELTKELEFYTEMSYK